MKYKNVRRIILVLISAELILCGAEPLLAAETAAVSTALSAYSARTAEYVYKKVTAPAFGSIGGEWAVIGLSRADAAVPDEYYQGYLKRLADYVKEKKGILSARKYSEYSRVILALSALGVNARDFAGYDLTLPLGDYEMTLKQGLNGAVFALLALDSQDYPMPRNPDAKIQASREMYVGLLLERQNSDGGWTLSLTDEASVSSDSDTTAMALQALSKYTGREDVRKAVDRAVDFLSGAQLDDGGYATSGVETCESTAQVIIALCELGIKYDDARFTKNGKTTLDALKSFMAPDGGFRHQTDSKNTNQMATEQALCALAALERAEKGQSSFYSMGDSSDVGITAAFPDRDPEVKQCQISKSIDFSDVPESDTGYEAIFALADRGIINGRSEKIFAPDGEMTRAEFCTITVRALGLEADGKDVFEDVKTSDWFYGFVGKAYSKGIVNGIGDRIFSPDGTITREAAAVMVARAAKLCGLDTSLNSAGIRDVLSQFPDYRSVSNWAMEGLAFCYSSGILDESELNIRPSDAITRREVALMIFGLLKEAELL